jgi:hypothetical protein
MERLLEDVSLHSLYKVAEAARKGVSSKKEPPPDFPFSPCGAPAGLA